MKQKTPSAWITHVKAFAKENGLKYNEALKDSRLKIGYVKVERVKKSKESKMEEPMMMEMNRNYDKLEPQMKVKKEKKKKKEMVMVVEAPPMMIQTESGDLQQVVEAPKKVRAKRAKKDVMST